MTSGRALNTARNCWLRSPNTSNVNNEYYINTSGASNNNNANNAYAFLPDNAQYGEPVSGVGPAEKRNAMHWERATRQTERPENTVADDVGRKTSTSMNGGTF